MSLKQNRILKMTFVECQFGVMWVYEFLRKGNSDEDICWVSVWSYVSLEFQAIANCYEDVWWVLVCSYVSLWVSTKSGFWWTHLLSLSLELCEFMRFKKKGNSSEGICSGSVSSYVNLWVSNKTEFLWINLLSLSLMLCNFMKLKQKRILLKTFIESQFEVI